MLYRHRNMLFLLVILALAAASLPACSGEKASVYELAPISALPPEVRQAPVSVQESYRFAIANPDILEQIPCYCGCGAIGHQDNYMCYVAEVNSDGTIVVDNHALGCSLCVDITRDTMRLLDEGQSVPEIREYIDNTYSKYGSSNMP